MEANGGPVVVIGGGVMGEVIARAAIASRGADGIVVVERREERAAELRESLGVSVVDDAERYVAAAAAVIVAVKPQDIPALLAALAPRWPDGALLITVAVGLSAASYEQALPGGARVVRVMPNTPAIVGAGVAVISPGSNATEADLALTEELLAPTGQVLRVPEKQQDAVAAISGSGPAYAFYVIDALAEAGVRYGLPRDLAQRLAAGTIAGAGIMARDSDDHPVLLRERVSSPGGTTVAALAELDAAAVRAAFVKAVGAAIARAQEISGKP